MAEKGLEKQGASGSTRLKKLGDIHRQAAVRLTQLGHAESVAQELGVSPHTVASWKRSPVFKRYCRTLRREAYDDALGVLQLAAINSVAKIVELISADDPQKNPEGGRPDIALSAARTVLDLCAKWFQGVDAVERLEALERRAKKWKRKRAE